MVYLITGTLWVGLAGVLLLRRFSDPRNRALALVFALVGLALLTIGLRLLADDPTSDAAAFWRRMFPYFHLPQTWAFLYFVAIFPRRQRWLPPGWLAAAPFLGAMVVVDAWYLADHSSYAAVGPLVIADLATRFLIGACPLFLARSYYRQPHSPEGTAPLYVALGLGLILVYQEGLRAALVMLRPSMFPLQDPAYRAVLTFHMVMEVLLLGAFAGLLAWHALRGGEAAVRRAARRSVLALVPALASAIIVGALLVSPRESLLLASLLNATWFFAAPLLIVYAVAKHQSFGIDLRVKRTIKHSTVAAAFIGLYVVVSVAGQRFGGELGPYLGIAAAASLLLVILPLQRLADRVATAVVPGVEDPNDPRVRGLRAYRATLAGTLGGNGTTEREATMLRGLRRELGVTENEHARMVQEWASASGRDGNVLGTPDALFLGRYRVERLLGEGGAGAAYLCRDERLARDVVVKRLRAASPDQDGVRHLVREARALCAIRHPQVVSVHEVEQLGDEAFIIMEHLEGGSLRERLGRGPLTRDEFRIVAADLLGALAAVHAAGLVHRDVKPSNVLLTRDGRAKLSDFGIAHIPGFETTAGPVREGTTAIGTIRYMSPEQAKGRQLGPSSDLFSAAATLYEAYTGGAFLEPLSGESAVELQMRAAAFVRLDRPPGTHALGQWFVKALDPVPERRHASARAALEALQRALPEGQSAGESPARKGATPARTRASTGPRG